MAGTITSGRAPQAVGEKSRWRFFPLAVILGLFFVALVNAYMVVSALGTFPGEAGTVNGYELSNEYNRILNAQQTRTSLGWKVVLFGKDQHLALRLTDRDGQPLSGLTITATATRPVGPLCATELTFQSDGAGRWMSTRPLDLGQWLVDLKAASPGRNYVITRRVIIR